LEITIVSDVLDARLERENLVIAGQNGHGLELKALCQMHRRNVDAAMADLDSVIKRLGRQPGGLDGGRGAVDVIARTDEYADLMGLNANCRQLTQPSSNARCLVGLGWEHANVG
jgi:hypothetical protein